MIILIRMRKKLIGSVVKLSIWVKGENGSIALMIAHIDGVISIGRFGWLCRNGT